MHIWRDLSTCHPGTLFRKQPEEHKDLEYRQKAKNKINSNFQINVMLNRVNHNQFNTINWDLR